MKSILHPLLLLALCLLAGAHVRAEGGASVVLHAEADIGAPRYTLSDIADIWTDDEALQHRLGAIAVGVTPRVGYSQTVSRAQVETLVGRDAGSAPVTYGGATQVKVRGRGQRLAQDTLTDTAAQALYAALAGKYTTMELQPVGESDGVSVPSGNYRLAARVPAPQTPSRRMSVLVDVLVDGRIYATVPVWFGVHASRPGFVARVPVAAGETLKAEQFRVQNVPVTEQNSESLPSDTRFGALRTRRSLEPGAVLTMAHVESRPAVSRSEKVALRVVSGAVTIETSGVALSDARMGEMIKVKPAYGSEIVTARVVGDGLVAVGAK